MGGVKRMMEEVEELLVQHGVMPADEAYRFVWADPAEKPFALCVETHGNLLHLLGEMAHNEFNPTKGDAVNRIYNHFVTDLQGKDIGGDIDLSQIIAVGHRDGVTFPVTVKSGATLHVMTGSILDRTRLVEAWRAWIDQDADRTRLGT